MTVDQVVRGTPLTRDSDGEIRRKKGLGRRETDRSCHVSVVLLRRGGKVNLQTHLKVGRSTATIISSLDPDVCLQRRLEK